MIQLREVIDIPGTATNREPVCDICGKDGSQIELRLSHNRCFHRCGVCQTSIVREVKAQESRKKLEPQLNSLPQSRNNDDQSMLQSAHDKLRRWHAGWSRECNLSALVVAVSASHKTLTFASKMRVLIDSAIAAYADGDDAALDWARGVYFVRAFDLAAADREHKFGEGKCPEILRARDASLLFLDDLGNENPGNEKLLLNVIDHRISANLPTWVSSGFTVDQLTERYGQALVRRLCEKGTGTLIDLFRAGAQLKAVR